MSEIWKDIPGLPKYQVSSLGRVKYSFLEDQRVLKGWILRRYHYVSIKGKHYRIHRLVGYAFGLIKGDEWVNHIDGNPSNNRLDNLEKSNPRHNLLHSYKLGVKKSTNGEKSNFAKTTEKTIIKVLRDFAAGKKISFLAKKYSLSYQGIHHAVNGKTWKYLDPLRKELGILAQTEEAKHG